MALAPADKGEVFAIGDPWQSVSHSAHRLVPFTLQGTGDVGRLEFSFAISGVGAGTTRRFSGDFKLTRSGGKRLELSFQGLADSAC